MGKYYELCILIVLAIGGCGFVWMSWLSYRDRWKSEKAARAGERRVNAFHKWHDDHWKELKKMNISERADAYIQHIKETK